MNTLEIMQSFQDAVNEKIRIPFGIRIKMIEEQYYLEIKTRFYNKPRLFRLLSDAFDQINYISGFVTEVDPETMSLIVLIELKNLYAENDIEDYALITAMKIKAYDTAIRDLLFDESFEGKEDWTMTNEEIKTAIEKGLRGVTNLEFTVTWPQGYRQEFLVESECKTANTEGFNALKDSLYCGVWRHHSFVYANPRGEDLVECTMMIGAEYGDLDNEDKINHFVKICAFKLRWFHEGLQALKDYADWIKSTKGE